MGVYVRKIGPHQEQGQPSLYTPREPTYDPSTSLAQLRSLFFPGSPRYAQLSGAGLGSL